MTDDGREIPLSWPFDRTVYLTLDVECDYGTALQENTYGALDATDDFVSLLERLDYPLTCFVQTEVLDVQPDRVAALQDGNFPSSFHPHSHTHSRREASDVRDEVERATRRFTEYFGERRTGYRFPNGTVGPGDYALLAEHGYAFDASIFPTWRPGHYENLRASSAPSFHPGADIYELPFTVGSRLLPIPTGLSYCRMLGRPFIAALVNRPPATVVFNVHMHDLVTPPSYDSLSPLYRFLYGRNDTGFEILERVLTSFERLGYTFRLLDEAHEALATGR